MVGLIRYEIKKNFIKWQLICVMLVFLIANGINIFYVYRDNSQLSSYFSDWKEVHSELMESYGGTISTDKIAELLEYYNPLDEKINERTAATGYVEGTYTGNLYSDWLLLMNYFVQPLEYMYTYQNYTYSVRHSAVENQEFYAKTGNDKEVAVNSMIEKSFANRKIEEFQNLELEHYYFKYDFSTFLVILVCIYALSGVFVNDKASEMDILLLTCKRGGKSTVTAKIAASIAFMLTICTLFWLQDIVLFQVFFGESFSIGMPLYAVSSFADTAYTGTIGAFLWISACYKTLGIVVLGSIYLTLSACFRRTLYPITCNLGITFFLIYLFEMFMDSRSTTLRILNPISLIVYRDLFMKADFFSVGNYVQFIYYAAAVSSIILSALFLILLSQQYGGRLYHGGRAVKWRYFAMNIKNYCLKEKV